MTVLVTGATGYLGHHLVGKLAGGGESVVALVRPTSGTDRLAALGGRVRVHVDDGTPAGLAGLFKATPMDAVYHLAACTPGRDGREDESAMIEANVHLGIRLLDAAVAGGCPVFVNTGTYSQFDADGRPRPNSLYGETKQAFQDVLAERDGEAGLAAVTLIPFEIYGPGDWRGKFTAALSDAARGGPVDMTAGEQVLDMVHVSDAADAFVAAAERLRGGGIEKGRRRFFLGSGRRATLKELAAVFETACGRPLAVNWGGLAYRPNQIFTPCPAEPVLPGWAPAISLEAGFAEIVRELNLSDIA